MIETESDYEGAMAEYHRLADAADDSADAARREALQAEILEFQMRQGSELEKGQAEDDGAEAEGPAVT